MQTENNREIIVCARFIFRNYNRMKMEIKQLGESISYIEKTAGKSIDSDIYSASVSHPDGGNPTGSHSADKVPKIAENLDRIRGNYAESIYILRRKKSMLERAVKSVDIFTASLEWTDKTILTRRFLDESVKNLDETAAEVFLTPSAVKKKTGKLMFRYAKSANFDISAVLKVME